MEASAPVELLLVEFPHNEFTGEIVTELLRLSESGTIRVLDLLLVRKDADGTVEWIEAADAGDTPVTALVAEPSGLLGAEDVEDIAEDLAPDSSVGMLVFEHTWAAGLAGAIRSTGGRLLDWTRVPAEALNELNRILTEED